MDQFMKIRKKMSMAESTRQVLNKSIDLLHKLSNKKMAKDTAKKELSAVLSQYVSSLGSNSSAIDEEGKVKLEIFLDQAYEIIEKVDAGDAPLYEAIMMMNKVVVNNQVEEKILETRPKLPKMRMKEELYEEDDDEEEEDDDDAFKRPPKEPRSLREVSRSAAPPVRFEPSIKKEESYSGESVEELIGDVIRKKAALERSMKELNAHLQEMGFELRSVPSK